MSRIWCALIVVAVCAGCRNSPPVYDPFLGKTVVDPPGTAIAPSAPPYYTSPPASAVSPPLVSPPAGTPIPAAPTPAPTTQPPIPYSVPQGFAPGPAGFSQLTPNASPVAAVGGSSVQPAANTQPAVSSALPSGTRPVYGPPGGGMSYPQAAPLAVAQQPTIAQPTAPALLQPSATAGAVDIRNAAGAPTLAAAPPTGWQAADDNRPANDVSTSAGGSSATISPNSSGAIRIVEPTATVRPVSNTTAPARPPTEFRPANTSTLTMPGGYYSNSTLNQSLPPQVNDLADLPIVQRGSIPSPPSSGVVPVAASTSSTGNYGYQAQYQWVKGKLEYSQSARTWRLRYIPPEAANDNYGGSVILSDPGKLAGFQHGDYVVAYGTIGQANIEGGSFAALYNVTRIQKQ